MVEDGYVGGIIVEVLGVACQDVWVNVSDIDGAVHGL